MSIDERIVDSNAGMRRGDVADTPHVGSQVIDLIDVPGHLQAFIIISEVRDHELVSIRCLVFRSFDVDTAHNVSAIDEIPDEMVPDEAACASHQNGRFHTHVTRSLEVSLHGSICRRYSRSRPTNYWNDGVIRLGMRSGMCVRARSSREIAQLAIFGAIPVSGMAAAADGLTRAGVVPWPRRTGYL